MAGPSDSVKMLALGRQFTIGTLYNYVEDVVVSNIRLWDPNDVARSAVTHKKVKEPKVRVHQMNIEQQCDEDADDDGDHEPWMSDLGIDDHSAMSLTAGLLRSSIEGAWKYAKDRLDGKIGPFASGSEVAVYCRRSSKKVSVDPTSLEVICRAERLVINKATHVVVAITYGHEAFCIFSHQDLQNKMAANKELVEKIVENAHFFASGLLEEKSRLEADLDEEGDEEDGGNRFVQLDLQCLLYSDLANTKSDQSWTSNSMVKQFEICRKLLGQHKSSVLPLKVWLYPIGKLIPNKGNISKSLINHTDVSRNLMILCQSMLERLRRVRRETDLVIGELKKLVDWLPQTILESIKYFDELMTEFTLALFKYLSEWTASIRKGQKEEKMADMLKTIEKKSPFFQKELRHWLKQHKKQIETLQILIKVPGVQFESKLEHFEKAIKNGSHQSFAVVLHLPNLCEQSDGLLQEMSSFIGTFTSDSSNWEREQDKRTVMDPLVTRRFLTLSKEFSSWIADHNSENTDVRYIVFYDERPSEQNLPILQLYDGSSGKSLSMNFTIPKAPGQVTIGKNHRGVITLHWAAEERTDFSSYLIQYRTTDNPEEIWNPIQHLSNTITIEHLHSEKSYIFRVAIVTQGGRSPFGPVSENVTIDPICPPPSGLECQYTTDTSIAILWKHQMTEDDDYGNTTEETIQISSYSIECWSNESSFIQRSSTEKTITLEPLVPGTEYCVQVSAICTDTRGSTFYSSPSPISKIRTLDEPERAALIAQRVSQKCSSSNLGIDVYNLPLKKYRGIPTPGVCHYAFGERSNSYSALIGRRRRRTILVLGATGSGKTTLINAMVNYMLGIQWKDDFRFKLIDEPDSTSQAYSQTKMITAYDLYEMKGSRLDYSLTVVDTPGFGDTKGLERDKKIMEQIQEYFKSPKGVQQLEAVCFVVQSSLPRLTATQKYIFDSILSIFGKDIKDNIRIMVTFSDGADPPVLEAVKEAGIPSPTDPVTGLPLHHKFNNSIFFTSNKKDRQTNEFNRTYFEMAVQGFAQFFDDLSRIEAKSLTLTREVLEERKRLEALVEGLQMRTQIKLTRVDEFQQIKKILTENKEQIEANKNFEFEVEFLVPKTTDISGTGQFTTNCQKCQMTCHFPCRQAESENKNKCSVMDPNSGRCKICNCQWNDHFNQKYRYEMVTEKVMRTSDAIRQQYQAAKNETLTNEELLNRLEMEINEHEKQLLELMEATYPHIRRLDEIALRPHPFSAPDYINLMIATEKQEHRPGYQKRIVTLEKLRQMAEITANLIRNRPSQSVRVRQPQRRVENRRFSDARSFSGR